MNERTVPLFGGLMIVEKNAVRLAEIIEMQFGRARQTIKVEPSDITGSFEVYQNDELIYSKIRKGRLPQPEEILKLIKY